MQQQVQRKGIHAGVQTEFTIFAPVKPGEGQAIRQFLTGGGTRDPRQASEAVQSIGTLHEARYALFDNDTRLLFCSSFDGTWDKYIDDFATTYIAVVFDAVFSHCEGFPGVKSPDVKDWFMSNAVEALVFTTVTENATVKQVLRALEVEKAFQQVLDDPAAGQALQDPALKPLLELAST